jgi:hypothetical protein
MGFRRRNDSPHARTSVLVSARTEMDVRADVPPEELAVLVYE